MDEFGVKSGGRFLPWGETVESVTAGAGISGAFLAWKSRPHLTLACFNDVEEAACKTAGRFVSVGLVRVVRPVEEVAVFALGE